MPAPGDRFQANEDRVGGWNSVLSRFFQEHNIRWMLVLGAATVLGSTLMLVSREWSQWSASLKCITIMTYTLVSGFAAHIAGMRLGLRATCRVLQTLTVFLCPTCFFTLNWLTSGTASQSKWPSAEYYILLLIAAVMTLYFVRGIFRSWLLRDQPVFLLSYCLLCFSGALPAVSESLSAVFTVAVLWAVMTVGVIKVNRHVFWLTENHQRPRIFGFFPILLLSVLFMTVACLKSWKALPLEWVGTMAVLQSFTILQTARAVTAVYRQRTGGLIHPLPWAIVLPIVIGMSVMLGGVALSFHGFSWTGSSTWAAVPTAILAAGLLWSYANDMRSRPLTWLALLMTAIAYQNLPSLCPEIVRALKGEVAAAIHQSRLPLSFYGITYLPLLMSLAGASRLYHRKHRHEMSGPIRQFVILAGMAWCCFSSVNAASAFWVSLVYSMTWLILAMLLEDRRLVVLGIACAVCSAIGLGRFAVSVGHASSSVPIMISALCVLSIVWTTIPALDRWQSSLVLPAGWFRPLFVERSQHSRRLFLVSGQTTATLVLVVWLIQFQRTTLNPWATSELIEWGLLALAFASQILRARNYLAGFGFWLVCGLGAMAGFLSHRMTLAAMANAASLTAGFITCAGYLIVSAGSNRDETWSDLRKRLGFRVSQFLSVGVQREKDGLSRLAEVCVVPLVDLCLGVLACLAVFFHLPELLCLNFLSSTDSVSISTLILPVWLILATGFFQHRSLTLLAGGLIPLILYAGVEFIVGHDLSAATQAVCWTCGTLISSGACRLLVPRNAWALRYSTGIWGIIIYAGCLFVLGTEARLASIGVLIAFSTLQLPWTSQLRNTALLIGAEIQALLCLAAFAGLHGFLPAMVVVPELPQALVWCLPGLAACSLMPWKAGDWFHSRTLLVWSVFAQTFTLILMPFGLLCADEFSPGWQLMLFTAILLATNWLIDAVRFQRRWTARVAFSMIGMMVFWLACIDVVDLTSIATLWSLLLTAVVLTALGTWIHGRPGLGILTEPLLLSGRALPFVVSIVAITSSLSNPGQETAVLKIGTAFSCAAVYYLGWLHNRSSRDLILALMTLNLAVVAGAFVARLTDPQFYLVPLGASILVVVQLMRDDIPAGLRDACRYVGAFLILCSPLLGVTGGSWWHVVSLIILSLCVALVGIGLRVRTLTFSGTAFLVTDLFWMVIKTSIDHPGFLWISGVVIGAAVIALAAYCENHRERILGRIRVLTAELATWN